MSDIKTYRVEGTIELHFDLNIKAKDRKNAHEIVKEYMEHEYFLNHKVNKDDISYFEVDTISELSSHYGD